LTESLRLHYSKFDLLVNVLVGLMGGVLAGFWIAAGEVDARIEPSSKRSLFFLLKAMLPWIALVGVLATGVEVAQVFFVNRIPNVYDIISQITGFLVAMVVVARTGKQLILARGIWFDSVAEHGFFIWSGLVTALVYLVTQWWPMIPAITPGEIRLKLRQGLILGELRGDVWPAIRDQMEQDAGSLLLRLIVSSVLGWWIGRILPARSRIRHFLNSALVGFAIAVITESGRGLIDQLDVSILGFLFTLVGLCLGMLPASLLGRPVANEGAKDSLKPAEYLIDKSGGSVHSASMASRLEWLDGLRAMACSYVFGVHFAQQISLSDEGAIWSLRRFLEFGLGVSFFFLLSAGLLSLPWWKGGAVAWNWSRFIRDKMIRILPPYLILLAALFFLTQQYRTTHGLIDLTSHLLFVHNFQDRTLYGMSPPLWYLACQMQAYLVLPILFMAFLPLAKKRSGKAIVCAFLAAVSWIVFYFLTIYGSKAMEPIGGWFRTQPVSVMHSLASHLPNLFIGAMAGWIVWSSSAVPWSSHRSRIADVTSLAILGLMVVLAGLPEAWLPWLPASRYGFPWMPLLMLFLLYLISGSYHMKRCLQWRPLVLLGKISYGFYIYHYSILIACKAMMGYLTLDWKSQWILFLLLSFPATCLFSYASYHFLELPIERFFRGKQQAGKTS
jgi:peptidoglycan/LPS O-acetylase OafA/YrhL